MTRAEKIELLRYIGGAGNVYLDTPEQRALLRKGMIRIVESAPVIFKQARRFAVITDAGTVAAMKIVVDAGKRRLERGTRGTKFFFGQPHVFTSEKK